MSRPSRTPASDASLAVGAALLAGAFALAQVRLDEEWARGVHLAVALVAALIVLGVGLAPRRRSEGPAGATSALLLAGIGLFALADFRFLQIISETGLVLEGRRSLTAFFGLIAVVALVAAWRSGSAACLLVGSLASGGAVVAAVHWLFDPGVATYRPVLLGLALVFAAAAYATRARPRHRDVLVDAAGLALIGLGQLSAGDFALFFSGALPDAWEAVLLTGGLMLVFYAARTHAPGPGVIAVFVLLAFGASAVTSDSDPDAFAPDDGASTDPGLDLVGWPLVLLGLSLAAFVFGILRRGHDPDRAVH